MRKPITIRCPRCDDDREFLPDALRMHLQDKHGLERNEAAQIANDLESAVRNSTPRAKREAAHEASLAAGDADTAWQTRPKNQKAGECYDCGANLKAREGGRMVTVDPELAGAGENGGDAMTVTVCRDCYLRALLQ